MQSVLGSKHERSHHSGPLTPCPIWSVDLKLTHLDWNPEATLIHFQAQYRTICELDYKVLQSAIQNVRKTEAAVDVGEFCLVEDLTSARWYRGRVQNQKEDLFDVFLIDHGNVLSVDVSHISPCSNDLLMLPPKVVSGFLANVLLLQSSSHSVVDEYFSSQVGRNITGYIQALLPHKVLLLEAPDISSDLVRHGFGRHVDTDTFFFLVEMLTEVPLKQYKDTVPDLLLENSRGQEFCFKTSSLQGYDNILSFFGPRLRCGTRAKVRVTAAVNPGLFYCQMASMETDLWEMSKKLQMICEHRTKERTQKTPENLGLLCSVKRKDGKWYRGFVQFLPVNSQVRVLFIDYGFFESVKVENVHRLPHDFFSIPIMAFPCSLSSLTDHCNVSKSQQLTFLKTGLLGALLDVEIGSFDEEQHLYSITVFGVEDSHVKQPGPIQKLPSEKVETVFEAEEKSVSRGGYLYCETIIGKSMDKLLEVEEVQVDSVFVGYVEHIRNPNHFWIRTRKRNDEFQDMMTKMTEHFSEVKLNEDVLLNPKLGALCCAVYEEDMHFYRGIVTDKFELGAEVLFIDFGNIEKVPHMLIKNIPETFASKSAFAMCCTLVNVFPLDDVWTSTTSDLFKQAVSNKALLVHVLQMKKNKFVVDLFEMGSDNSRSITELLISSEQAGCVPIEPVVQHNVNMTEITRHPKQWDDSKEENNTCKDETEKSQGPASFKALSIKPGCEFAVTCCYISSPSDFWCQPQDKAPALKELMEKVQQYYSTHTVPLQSRDSCCVAKSPQDGRWYRGFIIARQTGHATVMLVDFGLTIQVSESNLQAIMPGYACLEGQAFRCSLYNLINPADPNENGEWSPRACDLLKEFVLNSADSLKCQVVSQLNVTSKGLFSVVDLHNTQTKQSVTNTLIEEGLARSAILSTKKPSAVFPESFVYSPYDLSPGKEEHVYVTHVDSQWEVYCHLEKNYEIIEELEKKILEESEKMMQASKRAVVKKLCLAKYFDGKWYRGLVHPVQSPLHLSVFFVDYGNTNISEKTNVMFIPRDSADLLYTPMQALRCSLSSVSKKELYAEVKEWLHGAVLNKQVRAVILGKNKDGSFDVELFDGEVSINEKVKELVLSLSHKPKPAVTFDMILTKKNNKPDNRKSPDTSVRYKCQPKMSSKFPTVNRDSKKTPPKTAAYGKPKKMYTRVKQQNENLESVAPVKPHSPTRIAEPKENQNPKNTLQHRKETEIRRFLRLPDKKVTAGLEAKCFVSHIDSVHSFFLQLSEDEPAILKMHEDLNSGTFRVSLKTATSLRIGDFGLAEYEEDGALYRSVVKTCEGNSSYTVEFVDYGNSAVVEKEKIYSIPKEYLSQPRFSIACSLLDRSTHENDASFTDAVMDKPLTVNFVHRYGTRWKVKVEILDGEVDVEASAETEKEQESPTSSCEPEDKPRSDELNTLKEEAYENEISESDVTMSTVKGEDVTPEPTPVTLSTKLTMKCCRTEFNNKNNTKTKTSCVTMIRDYADDFIPIQVKDTEKGIVLSVNSDGSFYLRLTRTNDLLTALESRIADNLYKCKVVARDDVKQGLQVLVQSQDKKWQRAVVRHLNEEKCTVFLVDHGIEKEIPSGSFRQQYSDLMKIPNLAVLCKINSYELSEEEDAHMWCETLQPIIGKEVQLFFVCYSETDNLWMIEIVSNELLLRQVEATLDQNEKMVPSPVEGSEKGSTMDTNRPQQLVFAHVDANKGYCGFADAITNPFEFYIILEDLILVLSKVSVLLHDLPGPMSPLPEAHLIPGSGCLLKSKSKKKWCRAEIVHVDSTVVLNLVDYGQYECIPFSDCSELKRLPAEMAELPKVAYPCVLRGVKPVGEDGQWSDEAALFLQKCLYQRNLQIFFREFVSNTHWKVDVLADGVHVAKELVDAGHADYMDIVLRLRFQEQSCGVASPQGAHSEEECGEEDEGCDDAEAPDEAEGKTSFNAAFRSSQCDLM